MSSILADRVEEMDRRAIRPNPLAEQRQLDRVKYRDIG